ncbi:MAG: SpoIIE family protein phosphatase [Armatimonadetes bacterium]|nr:SpoIIE family protein phosphatase [Armatimonadota bacterium]
MAQSTEKNQVSIVLDPNLALNIVETVREPLVVLDENLRVVFANRSFYNTFKVSEEETVGRLIYELGNRQWDIPALKKLLNDILPRRTSFEGFVVEHDFQIIGRRIMMLNAREVRRKPGEQKLILLAIEDVTEQKQAETELEKYRKHLEQLVEERSSSLEAANRELQLEIEQHKQAEEELQRANERLRAQAEELMAEISERKRVQEALRIAYERERHIAKVLQKALVPAEPFISDNYPAAALYCAAYEEASVGGDFYDVFHLKDERMAILIGDVSGKGVEAASIASSARNIVRAIVYTAPSPSVAFARSNEILCTQGTDSSFITAFLAFLDPLTGRVTYSSAGHPPAAILRADGKIEFAAVGSIPLCVLPGCHFDEGEYYLQPGDVTILYTDGVTESRHDNVLFGIEGIERVLAQEANKEPDVICADLLNAAQEWSGGRLLDDIAIMVIKRRA